MKQPYQLAIALRYLRTTRGHSFISFISAVSMVGIGLAVAVLIVVLSVMNGFEHELQQRILGMVSDATINTATASPMPTIETAEMNEIKLWPRLARR